MSRRSLLKGAAAVAGAAPAPAPSPASRRSGRRPNITLRQFGTGVSNLNAIAEKCKADLGITLEMTAIDSDAAAQRAVTQPDSYDIADIEYWICKKVFPTGVLQPMDVKKIKYFDKIVPLFITGKLTPDSVDRAGHRAAHGRLRRRRGLDQDFAKEPTDWMTMIPTIYNADTLGIRPDLVGRDDHELGGHPGPGLQGQDLDPQHPVDRHHGRRHDHGGAWATSNMPTRAT